jgi:transcriptional/translational regulatory protein YebC/TACO1
MASFRMTPVNYLFEKKGLITLQAVDGVKGDFDELFDIAVEAGAEDVKEIPAEDGEPTQYQVSACSHDTKHELTRYRYL